MPDGKRGFCDVTELKTTNMDVNADSTGSSDLQSLHFNRYCLGVVKSGAPVTTCPISTQG
jgi:hypothetical protein